MPFLKSLSKIKGSLHQAFEKLGLAFYLRPQTYQVEYHAKIINHSDVQNNLSVVLPIPPSTEHQTIKKEPIFTPEPAKKSKDPFYQNESALFPLKLKPRASAEIKETFTVQVNPHHTFINPKFHLKDYHKNQEYKRYTEPNYFLTPDDHQIQELIPNLIDEEKNLHHILKKINHFLIQEFKYGDPNPDLYPAPEALSNECTDCGGFDTVFASLCIAAGIPTRIVSGFWAGHRQNTMHAWVEILLPDGKWIPADPSVEQLHRLGKSKKLGHLGKIGSDRIVLSIGCDIPIKIKGQTHQAPILQNPFVFTTQAEDSVQTKVKFTTKRI